MKVSKRLFTSISFACILSMTGVSNSNAQISKEVRISGYDRVQTAIRIADEFKSTENVIIATGNSYADALVASPLAYEMNAPILLNRSRYLDNRVRDKIRSLGAQNVVIVGGENSVGYEVENSLRNDGLNVSRISGSNRYNTSAEIAKRYSSIVNAKNVIIASGEKFPDALVAGPYASKIKAPILLSKRDALPSDVKYIYESINPENTIAVGGESSVDPQNIMITKRISGSNRYNTALEVAKFMNPEKAYIASGEVFADSLVAAPLAAKTGSPILLRTKLAAQLNVKEYVNAGTKELFTVGGPSTIGMGISSENSVYTDFTDQNNQGTQNQQGIQNQQKPAKKLTEAEKAQKIEEVKKELHEMINEHRKNNGVKPLKWYKEGEKGSNIRAEELSRNFSHDRPDGSLYSTAFSYITGNRYSGENIAYSYEIVENSSPEKIAKSAFTLWRNSPGHNENMLNSEFSKHSLGVFQKDGTIYFTDNFFYDNSMFTSPDEFIIPDNATEMSESKFNSMIPDIKAEFINIINDSRKKYGSEPLEIAAVYTDKIEMENEAKVNNPEYFNQIRKESVIDGYLFNSGESRKVKIYDGDDVDASSIASNLIRNVEVRSNDALGDKEIKAYNLALYFKDGYLQYTYEFYIKSDDPERQNYSYEVGPIEN